MMVDSDVELSSPTYWDDRYSATDGTGPVREWYMSYSALSPFLTRHVPGPFPPSPSPSPSPSAAGTSDDGARAGGRGPCRILHLGSGDSEIPSRLAEAGYTTQTCVDFSPVVVRSMAGRHAGLGIAWREADVRHMPELAPASFDVAFDKGTLDAMIHGSPWDPPDDVRENTAAYLSEVHRLLAPGGVFLAVSFRQPHFVRPLLLASGSWIVEMETLVVGESSFDYFGWCLRRKEG